MRPGSVIVDIAAEQGGNCELTRAGETVLHNGVKVLGPVNLPATLPYHASEMYARNLFNLLKPAIVEGRARHRLARTRCSRAPRSRTTARSSTRRRANPWRPRYPEE